ncbi:unnamed protein product [Brassicogethes aeneus]|uniref:Zinc finger CCCH domain-containing protein 15 n=1 Tax=Brassicogethes aeneus TaxID=1431903 RepID=A0A9P0ATV4_BRAAE|nr:unnamed protein product [Brassicogethes aeneus]
MPPKPKPGAPSKKTETKKKEKVIEDKTFGLKNKKGAKQQKFIQQVEKQVKTGGLHPLGTVDPKKLEKEKKLKEQKELASLFKPVQTQKVEKGADPKSILCAFFKNGQCGKGDKCKFSHDLTIERKAEKRSLYFDMRNDEDETMENWDEEKLKEVIVKKHGAKGGNKPTTDIICKHFLEAVEKSNYGWFWSCPSGESCFYRHALPPGFVLKKDKKRMEEQRDKVTLEDLIEKERAALGPHQTKVTLESFIAWKKRKIQEKKDNLKKEEDKKRSDFKAGRQVGLSGREMFSFNPEMATEYDLEDGDEAINSSKYRDEDEEEDIVYKEINLDILGEEAQEVDGSGTMATEDRFKKEETPPAEVPGSDNAESSAVPINENLFLDEDLDALDDEIENLDLEE